MNPIVTKWLVIMVPGRKYSKTSKTSEYLPDILRQMFIWAGNSSSHISDANELRDVAAAVRVIKDHRLQFNPTQVLADLSASCFHPLCATFPH